jgi:hypothetical protein
VMKNARAYCGMECTASVNTTTKQQPSAAE